MFSRRQYDALRDRAALVEQRQRGRVILTGSDRRSYLQGLLTNDIEALTAGTGCYAALLTAQGRMIADMRVLELGDAVLLDLPARVTAAVADRLDQFIFSEDVAVADVTSARAQFGVYGPLSAGVIATAFALHARATTSASPESELAGMSAFANGRWDFEGSPIVIARNDDYGVPGFDLYVDTAQAAALRDALTAAGVTAVEAEALEVVRVEQGVPTFGIDMDEETIPLEAGLEERAISHTKGCYVGQEIIIRVLHRGHGRVAKKLVGLVLQPGAPLPFPGDTLRAGTREIGRVTSAVTSPAIGRPIALGYVHRDFVEPGTPLTLVHENADLGVVLASLPFISRAAV